MDQNETSSTTSRSPTPWEPPSPSSASSSSCDTTPRRRRHDFIGPDDYAPIFVGILSGITVGFIMWQIWLAAGP